MTTTITADRLLPRPKLNCDGGYDVAVKGAECSCVKVVLIYLSNIVKSTISKFAVSNLFWNRKK